MKKIIGLVVILAALVLGSYYGMGLVTERTLKRSIDIVNQSTGLSFSIAHYDRHWFGSSAALNIQMHIPERVVPKPDGKSETIAAQNYTMDVPVNISHGPIIYSSSGILFGLGYAQSHLSLPNELVAKFTSYFTEQSTQPVLNFNVFVNYKNKSSFQIEVPAFKLVSKEGAGAADWLGMKGNLSVSSDLTHLAGNLTLDGIKVVKDKLNGLLGTVTSDYDLHKTNDGLYLGQAGVSLPSIVVTQEGKTLFDLTQFKVRSENSVTKGLFGSDFKASFEKILSNDKQYGPGLLEMSLKNLDANVLAQLNAQANKLKQTTGAERQQLMFGMLPQLPKLFAQGAGFEISILKLTVPEGDIDGHFTIALPKSESVNPFQIMQKIEGDGKFQIPATIVKKMLIESLKQKEAAQISPQSAIASQMQEDKSILPTAEVKQIAQSSDAKSTNLAVTGDATQQAAAEVDKKLAALVEAKLLIEQGQNYIVEFHLSQGKITVNGQPFDPATFKI